MSKTPKTDALQERLMASVKLFTDMSAADRERQLPEFIGDVCNEMLTECRVIEQTAAPEALRRDVPPEIFDSMAVYMELHIEKNEMIKPSMVADVLDALMRLIRKRWKAEAAESPLLEKP